MAAETWRSLLLFLLVQVFLLRKGRLLLERGTLRNQLRDDRLSRRALGFQLFDLVVLKGLIGHSLIAQIAIVLTGALDGRFLYERAQRRSSDANAEEMCSPV